MERVRSLLDTFTLKNIPDLHVVTEGALELFSEAVLPPVDFKQFKRPLVVGSGNAAVTGKILFSDVDAIFADESSYLSKLKAIETIDGAFLLSASGSKHATEIAEVLQKRGIPTVLLTNTPSSPASVFVQNTYVFPKNREPYTYNTSTYMGMILSKTGEDPVALREFIELQVASVIPQDLSSHTAFYLIVPEEFTLICEMFRTKFDELFGPRVMGRVFTYEQTKHAKTVIPLESELFISFGVRNMVFGEDTNRVYIPLPDDGDYASIMAIGYYVIGQIQKQLPPYYKERIEAYTKETSEAFGSMINPIVA